MEEGNTPFKHSCEDDTEDWMEHVNVPSTIKNTASPTVFEEQVYPDHFSSPFDHQDLSAAHSHPAFPKSVAFQLIEIVSDKQDLSFVEKVQISEVDIAKLCNALAPASARGNRGIITNIDFNALDAHTATVIGFYGDKSIMSRIFKKEGLPSDLTDKMDANRLKSGLYACLNGHGKLYLFYWDGREQLVEASRKDVTCNFVRYLVELSEVVYVCLDGQDMEEAAMKSVTSHPTKRQRTQRLQISLCKESENDLKLLQGFKIQLPKSICHNQPCFQLPQGLHRCIVLTSARNIPKLVPVKKSKTETVPTLKAWLMSSSSIDCTQLPDEDFLLLLDMLGKQEELKTYRQMEDTWKQRHAEVDRKVQSLDTIMKAKKEELASAFHNALEYFLIQRKPWEESLVLSESSKGKFYPQLTESATATELSPPKFLLDIECKLCSIWTDHDSQNQRFLYYGAKVQIMSVNNNGGICAEGKLFSIGVPNSGSKKACSPICFGQHVVLTSDNVELAAMSQPCIASLSKADGDAFLKLEPIILNGDTKLVLTIMGGKNVSELVVIRHIGDEEVGMKAWLDTLSANGPTQLHTKAAASSYLISKLDKPLEDKLLEKLLKEKPLKSWTEFLPAQASSLLVEYLSEQKDESIPIHDQAVRICSSIYKDARQRLWTAVESLISKEICPTIRQHVTKRLRQERDSDKKSLSIEQSSLLSKMKSQCSTIDDASNGKSSERLKLCLLSLQNQQKHWIRNLYSADTKMTLHYSFEELETETLTWRAIEMVPEKGALDELMQAPSSGRVVIPVCSKPAELITLNPKLESLSGVVIVKSGQLLTFVEATDKSYLHLYYCPRLGMSMEGRNPIRTFKRGHDLWAFDEVSRFLAMYDRKLCTIKAFRFDEAFQHMDWAGGDIQLSQYSGSSNLVWMELVPGKREILLVDDQNRLRVCELAASMMRPRHIVLPSAFLKARVTADSSCLIVFTSQKYSNSRQMDESDDVEQKDDVQEIDANSSSKDSISAHVYLLDDSLSFLKCLPLDSVDGQNVEQLCVSCKYFGTQMHLIFLVSKVEETVLVSHVIQISSAQQTFQLQKVSHRLCTHQNDQNTQQNSQSSSSTALDYIFHVFDKYAISPPLCHQRRSIQLCVLLNPPCNQWNNSRAKINCEQNIAFSELKLKEKGKEFTELLSLLVSIQTLDDSWHPNQSLEELSANKTCKAGLGGWIQKVLCLVPLQVARAENNALKPLVNGLQIPANATYSDAVSLASLLRFGLYDLVLASWKGEVKVISSMGKQSSGKSYLLNHLAGSLLDVAGGRCTDGVWLTMRCESDCLYVLLDFEGLGSFERSEQEDMFLSILNAAVSDVTIFNKKDFHLDKETEAIFQRFQDGVSLVKADEKLFKGLFYMAIKDVDSSDVEDLKSEFFAKINHICSKSSENFLTSMYGGQAEIAALPPFQRPDFQESIGDIGSTIQEIKASYNSGRRFMEDFKLVISQISARDWSSVDSKRVAMRLSILRSHLEAAIRFGNSCDGQCLLDFDTEEEITDDPICIEGIIFSTVHDAGLELIGPADYKDTHIILEPLKQKFELFVQRRDGSDEKWHDLYQTFLVSLMERREVRVLDWLQVNTLDFGQDGDMQKLILEATTKLANMKNKLQLCTCKCNKCFLTCILEKGHQSDHSCLGSHACSQECSYCVEERGSGLIVLECNDLAGHGGAHDCKKKTHTCEKPCMFSSRSSNCNKNCSLRVNHQGEHRCNSLQHMCKEKCSLPLCDNACAAPFEMGEHEIHACHEKFCPLQCSMEGCTRTCVTQDHFHYLVAGAQHFCANEHPCPFKCESPGVCNVVTELLKQTLSFHGKRSDFEYDYVSEQSEDRKGCCLMIPPFIRYHEGTHMHSTNANVVHYCDVRCPACDYYCQLPFGHAGLHRTVHGNMRNMKFVAEVEEIDVQDRKYVRGESGVAEMCMMHCKARGRGHTHLAPCPENGQSGCCTEKLYDGARHLQTKCAGLDMDVPLDEMSHQAFWEYIRFVDPCEEAERETFGLCDHFCRSDEHNTQSSITGKSYCTEKLWHTPVPRAGAFQTGAGGYVTEDGHHFTCNHSKVSPHNVIFVMDKSGSMSYTDITPTMLKFRRGQNNRLGCIYEAVLRFIKTRLQTTMTSGMQSTDSVSVILFDNVGHVSVKLTDISEQIVDGLLGYSASGGTTYSSGLEMAEQLLSESSSKPELDSKGPVVIFLSDGGNYGGTDPVYMVQKMKQQEPRLVFHTIMFGKDPYAKILQDMARAGDGTFQLSLDEVQLARSFEGLAKSLKPKLAALCSSS